MQQIFDLLCEKLAEEGHINATGNGGNTMFICSTGIPGEYGHLTIHSLDENSEYVVIATSTKNVDDMKAISHETS